MINNDMIVTLSADIVRSTSLLQNDTRTGELVGEVCDGGCDGKLRDV